MQDFFIFFIDLLLVTVNTSSPCHNMSHLGDPPPYPKMRDIIYGCSLR